MTVERSGAGGGEADLIGFLADLGDPSAAVRSAAAASLGELGDARAVEPLIARLWDEKTDVRAAAAKALGKLGDARALEPLLALARSAWHGWPFWSDPYGSLSEAVSEALVELGDARAVGRLVYLLPKLDERVGYAAYVLGGLGDADAVEPLITLLGTLPRDPYEPGRRGAVACALGRLGDARAVEPLIALLKDKDELGSVKQDAVEALGELGDARALAPLLVRLGHGDAYVRAAAAKALGGMRDVSAMVLAPLVARLADEATEVRAAAAEALGRLGDARAVEPLTSALDDTDTDKTVRKAAAEALQRLGDLDNDSTADRAIGRPLDSVGVTVSGESRKMSGLRITNYNMAAARIIAAVLLAPLFLVIGVIFLVSGPGPFAAATEILVWLGLGLGWVVAALLFGVLGWKAVLDVTFGEMVEVRTLFGRSRYEWNAVKRLRLISQGSAVEAIPLVNVPVARHLILDIVFEAAGKQVCQVRTNPRELSELVEVIVANGREELLQTMVA
jgi:HEAT repeat protein